MKHTDSQGCSLNFTFSGSTATIVNGQSCPVAQDAFTGGSVTNGTISVSGSSATVSLTFAVSRPASAEGGAATSTLTYSATCTKS